MLHPTRTKVGGLPLAAPRRAAHGVNLTLAIVLSTWSDVAAELEPVSVRVLVVMTPKIDQLIERLDEEDVQAMAAGWPLPHSSLVSIS